MHRCVGCDKFFRRKIAVLRFPVVEELGKSLVSQLCSCSFTHPGRQATAGSLSCTANGVTEARFERNTFPTVVCLLVVAGMDIHAGDTDVFEHVDVALVVFEG